MNPPNPLELQLRRERRRTFCGSYLDSKYNTKHYKELRQAAQHFYRIHSSYSTYLKYSY